jgi:hypothetical protein
VRVAPRDVHHGPGGRLRVALVLPAPRRPPCRGFRVAEDSPVDAVEFVRVGSRSKARSRRSRSRRSLERPHQNSLDYIF